MIVCSRRVGVLGALVFLVAIVAALETSLADSLEFKTRRQVPVTEGSSQHHSVIETVKWEPKQTAIVICDMWDQHWCQGACGLRTSEVWPARRFVLSTPKIGWRFVAVGCFRTTCFRTPQIEIFRLDIS